MQFTDVFSLISAKRFYVQHGTLLVLTPFHPIGPYLASEGPFPIMVTFFLMLFADSTGMYLTRNLKVASKYSCMVPDTTSFLVIFVSLFYDTLFCYNHKNIMDHHGQNEPHWAILNISLKFKQYFWRFWWNFEKVQNKLINVALWEICKRTYFSREFQC